MIRDATREVAMAARSTGRARKSKHCNWLEELDKTMEVLSVRVTWSDLGYEGCPLFILTRYPKLGRKDSIDVYLTNWEGQISEHAGTRCVIDGLDSHQRKQLAALLMDTIEALKSYNSARRSATRINKLAREPSRVSRLNKKIKKAQAALQELGDYAKPLDIQDVSMVADACLKKLSVLLIGDTTPEFYKSIKARYLIPKDPVGRGMVQLYWFFRHGIRLTGDEAEIRVGMLRNAFWTRFHVSEVPIRHTYITGQSKGCDTVRIAVRRFRGTLHQKSH
jgi:hypothetical protein